MPSTRRRAPARPPSPLERRALAEDRRHRAREELLEVRDRPNTPFRVLEVANPVRGSRYRVFVPAFPEPAPMVCECTDFARRGLGTCKHIEAAGAWLREQPVLPEHPAGPGRSPGAALRWREIDSRLQQLREDPRPESLRWRWAGAALYEPPRPA